MSIDWAAFTPWSALLGGALIGAAAAMLMLFNGRIAGISGLVGRLLTPQKGNGEAVLFRAWVAAGALAVSGGCR